MSTVANSPLRVTQSINENVDRFLNQDAPPVKLLDKKEIVQLEKAFQSRLKTLNAKIDFYNKNYSQTTGVTLPRIETNNDGSLKTDENRAMFYNRFQGPLMDRNQKLPENIQEAWAGIVWGFNALGDADGILKSAKSTGKDEPVRLGEAEFTHWAYTKESVEAQLGLVDMFLKK